MCPWSGSAPNQTFTRTDGTRTGPETWQEADAADVGIEAADHDTHDEDLADGIGACLKRDGGTQPTADLPMNGFKFTGVGNASARTHFPAVGQVQDASLIHAVDSGADTRTATLSPAITAYATGMLLVLKAASANTGSATLNANSVGAKTIKKGLAGASNLDANDIKAGQIGLYAYDGTNMQLLTAPEFPSGTKMLFQQTTAPTGWTKDTTHNDKALRVVSGTASTGGSAAFTTAFASRTIAASNLPVSSPWALSDPGHTHSYTEPINANSPTGSGATRIEATQAGTTGSNTTGITLGSNSGGGQAMNFAVAYVDVILATKD